MTIASAVADMPLDALGKRLAEAWRGEVDSEPESTVYRLSPSGVLAKRDRQHESEWAGPHWIVIDVPHGVIHHHVGRLLSTAAVASWSPLVRARPAIGGES